MTTQGAIVSPVVTRGMMDPVCDAEVLDSVDFEIAVNDGHSVPAHFGGRGLLPVCGDPAAYEGLEVGALQTSWHRLAFGEGAQCGGVTDLATEPAAIAVLTSAGSLRKFASI
jgi:hypothetical protein